MNKNIAKIAITKPLHNLFDYEIPEKTNNKGTIEMTFLLYITTFLSSLSA